MKSRALHCFAGLLAFLFFAAPAPAVILFGTGDPTANSSAPTGTLLNSGWQYEGQFGSFLGTAIATNFFITAKHIGGSVGQTFTFNGASYTTVAVFPDPSCDLQIWQVTGNLGASAPLFEGTAGTEVGLNLVVFGRGTQRGNSVLVGNDSHVGGWLWGAVDQLERWGTNVITSIVTDPTYGQLVRADFNSNAGPNEAHLSGAIPEAQFLSSTPRPTVGSSEGSILALMVRAVPHPAARIRSTPPCSILPGFSCPPKGRNG